MRAAAVNPSIANLATRRTLPMQAIAQIAELPSNTLKHITAATTAEAPKTEKITAAAHPRAISALLMG